VTNNEKTVKTTVIIVDDSFTHRTATAEMLTKSGFEVAEATDNPKYAVEAIRNIEPDVVLFDVVMSQMDGIEFIPLLEERVDLVLRRDALEDRAVKSLLAVLDSKEFRREAGRFSGNDYRDMGKITEV